MDEETRSVLIEFKTEVIGEIRHLSDKVESIDRRVESLDRKIDHVKEEVAEEMTRYVGIVAEDFQHKLDLVVEGHQMLNEKLDRFYAENQREHEEFRMNFLRIEGRFQSLERRNP